ncbi:MAG: transcriptional regulator [Mycobacteriales bacterium]
MSEYGNSLGARLRSIRQQQGLSLQGVEEKSKGRWKAVVVGSYERGDRAVTVARLAQLASFYDVPIVELLPEESPAGGGASTGKVVLDLETLSRLPAEDVGPLVRYAKMIQRERGDYNGRVLSIRQDDLRALAVVFDLSPGELVDRLAGWGVVTTASV